MIAVNRRSESDVIEKEGRSRNVDADGDDPKVLPSAFTTSKPNDADDWTRSSKGSSSKRSSRQVPDAAANGNEEEDKKRKSDEIKGDKSENGVADSSSKRRKRTDKDP